MNSLKAWRCKENSYGAKNLPHTSTQHDNTKINLNLVLHQPPEINLIAELSLMQFNSIHGEKRSVKDPCLGEKETIE